MTTCFSTFITLMDLQFLTLSVFLSLMISLFLAINHGKGDKGRGHVYKLPPGPRKLPIIGNLHQLFGSLPHRSLAKLSKDHGDVMHVKFGEVSFIVVSSSAAAKEVLKTHDVILANRPQSLASQIMCYDSTDIAFSPYGNYWRQLRKVCTLELLSRTRVQLFKSIREKEVENLIESIRSASGFPVNLSEKIFSLTNRITSRAAFGKKSEDGDEFIAVMKEVIKLAGGFDLVELFPSIKFLHLISRLKPKLEKFHKRVDRILDDIISDHKSKRKDVMITAELQQEDDLVDTLLKLQESGELEVPITANNIKAVILDIFTAGTETTSTAIEWAMSELIKNPRVMKQAQAEVRRVVKGNVVSDDDVLKLNYLKLVIKETLRLHPPGPLLLPREASEKCEIYGYEIPIKCKVIVNGWAVGRDPRQWINAENFEPERFLGSTVDFKGKNFEFIPFGAGKRICPGMIFGLANMELTLAQLLFHFDWKLPNEMKLEEVDMTEDFGATVRRKNDLFVIGLHATNLE